jgi:hypothetical protein
VFNPFSGFFIDITGTLFGTAIGSEMNFAHLEFDYRHFWRVFGSHVLTAQYILEGYREALAFGIVSQRISTSICVLILLLQRTISSCTSTFSRRFDRGEWSIRPVDIF